MSSYLSSQTQRVKIKTSYGDKSNIKYRVPQGSILGPLLLNIDSIDLLFECDASEIASYAGYTVTYSCVDGIPSIIKQLHSTANKLFSWFINNHMKVTPVKCHILLSTKNPTDVHLEGSCITFKSCEKLLIRITIDSHLNSDKHISDLWDKVSKKIIVLCQVTGFMSLEKRTIAIKMFVKSEFNHYLLLWMLHSRTFDNNNCLHKRSLRIAYSDYKSLFNTLFGKGWFFFSPS